MNHKYLSIFLMYFGYLLIRTTFYKCDYYTSVNMMRVGGVMCLMVGIDKYLRLVAGVNIFFIFNKYMIIPLVIAVALSIYADFMYMLSFYKKRNACRNKLVRKVITTDMWIVSALFALYIIYITYFG